MQKDFNNGYVFFFLIMSANLPRRQSCQIKIKINQIEKLTVVTEI